MLTMKEFEQLLERVQTMRCINIDSENGPNGVLVSVVDLLNVLQAFIDPAHGKATVKSRPCGGYTVLFHKPKTADAESAPGIKKAPWTKVEVKRLQKRQQIGHPYTCGKCSAELRPTQKGWKCVCGYTQDWAHLPDVVGIIPVS